MTEKEWAEKITTDADLKEACREAHYTGGYLGIAHKVIGDYLVIGNAYGYAVFKVDSTTLVRVPDNIVLDADDY